MKYSSEKTKDNFSLELISTREQAQELINEFEMNDQLREKGQLSLNGLSCLQRMNIYFSY
jgi:hypothetical protein